MFISNSLFLLSSSPGGWAIFGKFTFTMLIIFVVVGCYWLAKFALRQYRNNAQLEANFHSVKTQNIIMSATLDAEKRAAMAQGRLEGLMVNMKELSTLHRYKAESEALTMEVKALRRGRETLISERDRYLQKSNDMTDRLNNANSRVNDLYFKLKDQGEIEAESGKSWEKSGKSRVLIGEKSGKDQDRIKPNSSFIGILRGNGTKWDKVDILPSGKGKNFYLDKITDSGDNWNFEIGVFHISSTEPIQTVDIRDIPKGEFYEISDGLGILLCQHPECHNLKLGDGRHRDGKYCSRECRTSHAQIAHVS